MTNAPLFLPKNSLSFDKGDLGWLALMIYGSLGGEGKWY